MINFITGKLGLYATSFLGLVVAVFSLIQYGKSSQRKEQEVQDLKDYKETKERIDEVVASDDRQSAIARLRSNGAVRKSDMHDSNTNIH